MAPARDDTRIRQLQQSPYTNGDLWTLSYDKTTRYVKCIKPLGKGGVGQVFLCQDVELNNRKSVASQKSGELFAMKVVTDSQYFEGILDGFRTMRGVKHKCISEVHFAYLYESITTNVLFVQMPYYPLGDLKQLVTAKSRKKPFPQHFIVEVRSE